MKGFFRYGLAVAFGLLASISTAFAGPSALITLNTASIASTSNDGSAFLGDIPAYYAKQGDDITLTIDATNVASASGTLFGQAVVLTNTAGTTWEVTLTNINGTEGVIPFSITLQDAVADTLVVSAPTNAGNTVLFDKTAPTNPTNTLDLGGEENNGYKHVSKASYTWDGAVDSLSGLSKYRVRFFHPTPGLLNDVFVNDPTNTFTPTTPNLEDDPYFLYINTFDKAGNTTLTLQAFAQRYTLGLRGVVTDENGNALSGARVEVASRFGETCNLNNEICTTTTDANGEYLVIVQKDQNYTVSFWDQQYHMKKQDIFKQDHDTVLNAQLQTITNPHETQNGNQGVIILTNKTFPSPTDEGVQIQTKIYTSPLNGQISFTQIDENTFTVTSLSRVAGVRSNNPDVTIANNGNNTFTIINAGTVTETHSQQNVEGVLSKTTVPSRGTSANVSSGSSRIGGAFIASNGKANGRLPGSKRSDYIGQGDRISYEESLAYAAKLNEGIPARVESYVNSNGYVLFSGYTSGRLPLTRFKDRFQNFVIYRGGYQGPWEKYKTIKTTNPGGKEITKRVPNPTLSEQVAAMKSKYQYAPKAETARHPGGHKTTKEAYVTYTKVNNHHGLQRLAHDDTIHSVMTKKIYDAHDVNKFERKRTWHPQAKSRIKGKNQNVIKIKGAKGSVSMAQIFGS